MEQKLNNGKAPLAGEALRGLGDGSRLGFLCVIWKEFLFRKDKEKEKSQKEKFHYGL